MSSRRCAMRLRRPEALLLAAWLVAASAAAQPLTRDAVDAQAAEMRREAAASAHALRTEKVLRWKDQADEPKPKPEARPAWLDWIATAIEWINSGGRVLVWIGGAALVIVLLLRWRGLLGGTGADADARALDLPTHVQALDIRPLSLPADIGAAALAHWRAGRSTAALSLLYRGALSRLVHEHAVPIRGSSTEGDCLRLARPRLDDGRHAYLQALVDAWRRTVYAGRPAADAEGRALCEQFRRHWPPAAEGA